MSNPEAEEPADSDQRQLRNPQTAFHPDFDLIGYMERGQITEKENQRQDDDQNVSITKSPLQE